jgi:hypothetical protein
MTPICKIVEGNFGNCYSKLEYVIERHEVGDLKAA